jgi:prolyl-tRNA synthetase
VVRWEMRTRLFLRTAEFLWQEGHTAHATKEEALTETKTMVEVYAKFAEEWMAMPVIQGIKSESERFAGAEDTYCIEAMMQDGKALQAGTSHFLGQNFAKAFDVKFATKEGTKEYVWATSWGVSTRLMGALIMTHSDDKGLVLPPKLAPYEVVMIPIYKGDDQKEAVVARLKEIKTELENQGISVKLDDRDTHKPGWKFAEYELKGVPIRIAMGMRDVEAGNLELARRDTLEKKIYEQKDIANKVKHLLENIQLNLHQRAVDFREEKSQKADSYAEFKKILEKKGGFIYAHWDGTAETEDLIQKETKATIRCLPFADKKEEGVCMVTGKPSKQRVIFAKAY